jgi:uncharacterized protein (TIGR02996 family)
MAVYFVHRSHYYTPSGKTVTRFEDDTVSDWVRRNWELGRAEPERASEHFAFEVYGFSVFSRANEIERPPEAPEQLAKWLQEEIYAEGAIICHLPHLVSVQSDDDELMFAYYIFDDHYLARYPERAAFLLDEDWRLPGGAADCPFVAKEPTSAQEPAGKGEGATYWACEAYEDSCNLCDMGPAVRLDGVRIPDLARYLAQHELAPDSVSGYWLLLRARLFADGASAEPLEERFREALLDDPNDDTTWAAYSDWLQERGLPPAGLFVLERALRSLAGYPMMALPHEAWEAVRGRTVRQAREALDAVMSNTTQKGRPRKYAPEKSRIVVDQHVAQLCLHVDCWEYNRDVYHQWIFFDDRWAAAHPDLANSILRYTRCWDLLSPDGPHDDE